MPTTDDLLDPKQKIIAVYNKDRADRNLLPIDPNEYNFSNPQPYSGVKSPKNTVIYLNAKLNSSQIGRLTIYYDRINLSTIQDAKVVRGSASTVSQLINAINEELGVKLTTADVEEAALGNTPTFTLTASPLSLIFIGSTQIGYY